MNNPSRMRSVSEIAALTARNDREVAIATEQHEIVARTQKAQLELAGNLRTFNSAAESVVEAWKTLAELGVPVPLESLNAKAQNLFDLHAANAADLVRPNQPAPSPRQNHTCTRRCYVGACNCGCGGFMQYHTR